MKKFLTIIVLSLVAASAGAQIACDSWTKLNDRFSAVTVGDLDVTGDQITVEALFNMTGPSVNIVSKHWGGFDVNYLLRPVRAEITTTNTGFVVTDAGAFPCDDSMELNRTYHVALVYNGSMLKFYRNGILVSEVPASGDLVTNNWNTAIGEHAPVVTPILNGAPNPDYQNGNVSQGFYDESFRGYINEVKIWNVARTQDQIRAYMNTPLPDPATQTGLMGYWTFDSLRNKQGNSAYDGFLEGPVTIAQTNTTCNGIPDSCDVFLPCERLSVNSTDPQEGKITVNWQTQTENEAQAYDLQRAASASFEQFTVVGSVNANNGTGINNYSLIDDHLNGITNYFYRVGIKGQNGKVAHSAIINAKSLPIPEAPVNPSTNSLYPNPSTDGMFVLRFNSTAASEGHLMIYNYNGHLVQSRKINVTTGINYVPLDLRTCQKGGYYIKLVTASATILKNAFRL